MCYKRVVTKACRSCGNPYGGSTTSQTSFCGQGRDCGSLERKHLAVPGGNCASCILEADRKRRADRQVRRGWKRANAARRAGEKKNVYAYKKGTGTGPSYGGRYLYFEGSATEESERTLGVSSTDLPDSASPELPDSMSADLPDSASTDSPDSYGNLVF